MAKTGLNARLIETFRAIMMVGTVTGAAEMLHTSQPALSRSLQRLESVIGVTLFKRAKGRLVPTAQALAFFDEVQKSYIGLDHLANVAKKLKTLKTGHISVACAPVFSASFIAEAIQDFQKSHDEVTITVDTQLSPTISEVMSAQRFDIGLTASAVSPQGVKVLSFAELNEVCILPAGHRLASFGVIALQDLGDERWISFAGNDPARYRLDGLFESVGIRRRITAEAHHSTTVCEMVMRGVGIAVVNPFTAVEFLNRGLVMRRFGAPLAFNTFLLRSSYRPESALVESFVMSLLSTRDAFLARAEKALS